MNAGDIISRYRILGPLGRGGMGVVYRAEDTRLQRQVALKFLAVDSVTDLKKQRFLNEARAAAAAHHPNICSIYDIEEEGETIFIAMAFLDGQTLHRKIAAGPLTFAETFSIAGQIASGLDCAHSLGIVHRDIKSSNIMVDSAGHASIMDFGLALQPEETRLTVEGATVGTPGYMSPEQIRGLAVDRRTDIWSLGVLMFEMLTGLVTFERDNSIATIHAILTDPIPPLAALRQDVPPELIAVVEKAMAKRPEDRWRTAGELATELKRIESGLGSRATQTMLMPAVPADRKRARKKHARKWLGAGLLAAVLLAGGVFAYWWNGRQQTFTPAETVSRQVAVLPFQMTADDGNIRTISDGLVDAMTNALSDLPAGEKILAVPASEMRRRNISSAAEARRIYGVKLAVGGSAQLLKGDPGKVEFTITLQDAATRRQLGLQKFVFDTADPIRSRDQAVGIEMKLLNIDLSPVAQTNLRAGDTATPEAYSSYLQGRGLLGRYDVTGNVDKAIALFGIAVKKDPHYALAWSGAAEASLRKARETGDKQWSAIAMEDAERAVKLDGSLAIVHSVMGQVYANAGRQEEAIGEFRRAMKIAPGNAEAPRELARVYSNMGRFEESEASYLQATKSRPTDWYAHLLLGLFYYQRQRYSEAEAQLIKARDLTPDNDLVYRNLGGVLTMQGRYREAIEQYRRSLTIRQNGSTYAGLGTAYFYEHRYPEAVAAAEAAIDLDSTNYAFWGNVGIYYKWTKGSEQKSAPSLQHAIELGLKFLETAPTNYEVRADLAEYKARNGDVVGALAQLKTIPASALKPLASRLALVYELTGNRTEALRLIQANFSAASLNQIRDDPDLVQLWNSPPMKELAARLH